MAKKNTPSKRQLELRLSGQLFEIPPLWDVLLIGRHAPIGPEAARRMAESLAPGQFTLLRVEKGPVEALLVRKTFCKPWSPRPWRRCSWKSWPPSFPKNKWCGPRWKWCFTRGGLSG